MKNIYVSPEFELTVISTEDVVMISNIHVETSGSLPSIGWSEIS